jgi:GH35 family endo-1,4-beta-xylanase
MSTVTTTTTTNAATSLDADIRRHRTADATVTVVRPDGSPLANREVTVAQRNHKFLFGSTGWSAIALANDELQGEAKDGAERYTRRVLDLCNFVTLPFYWGRFEPERGKPDTKRLLAAAGWYADRGCVVKGHPLCWHTVTADWLQGLSTEQIIQVQLDRIRREVSNFRGVIDMWDVINEVVIMPLFDKYDNGITRMANKLGRFGIIRATFEAARQANPDATLLLNDFDMSDAYEILIEGCLENGIKIDVLGLQSHMHQGYWGVEKTQRVLAKFSRFGLPIHFTEVNLVSGHLMPPEIVDLNDYRVDAWPSTPEGEARQAEQAVSLYKTLLAHPDVQGVTWWDLVDGGWLKAPAGLIRRDGAPKPSYEALHRLIKGEWWTGPTTMRTDAAGRVRLSGFLGDYTLSADGRTAGFGLGQSGAMTLEVRLGAA